MSGGVTVSCLPIIRVVGTGIFFAGGENFGKFSAGASKIRDLHLSGYSMAKQVAIRPPKLEPTNVIS